MVCDKRELEKIMELFTDWLVSAIEMWDEEKEKFARTMLKDLYQKNFQLDD